jgi:hypothetical protein
MKTNDNISEEVLLLIEQKPFDMLTNNELALVIQYVSAEEYKLMQESVMIAKENFSQNDEPSADTEKKLLAAFNNKYSKRTVSEAKAWNIRLTPVRVAALLLVAVIISALFARQGQQIQIVYKYKTDTVFVAQEIPVVHDVDTVYITKVRYALAPLKQTAKEEKKKTTLSTGIDEEFASPLDKSKDTHTGTRMDEDEISKFFSYASNL